MDPISIVIMTVLILTITPLVLRATIKKSRKLEKEIVTKNFVVRPPRILLWLALLLFVVFGGFTSIGIFFDTDDSGWAIVVLAFIAIVGPLILIYAYYNYRLEVSSENIYYNSLILSEKFVGFKDIDYVKTNVGGYNQGFTMKIYSDGKRVIYLDSSFVGYSQLEKRLRDEGIAFK